MANRDAEEPRPPRRAGPRSNPRLPASGARPGDPDELGPSTFRPNPNKAPAPRPPANRGPDPSPPSSPSSLKRAKPPANSDEDLATPASPSPSRKKSKASGDREPSPASGGAGWIERILFGRVSTTHLAQFCRQFGAYLDAGVDLLRSLESLRKQFSRTALGPILERVGMAVRRGDSLTDAMKREPGAFDGQFLAMMTVAEARGGVPETLKSLASSYEAKQRLIRQARSAMIYPIAVLSIAFGVGMLLTVFILPGLIEILEDVIATRGGIDLPLPTRILMGINRFMVRMGWLVVPLVVFGSLFGLIWMYRRPKGKAFLDEIAIRLPVLGKLLRMIDVTRFARTLSALLEAGVEIGGSLDLTAGVLNLAPLRRAVTRARAAVMEGTELSDALGSSRLFPADLIAIMGSGEETGKVPESLERVADDYEERVEFMVKNLGSLVQPIIFIFLGGIVLFIAIAFFSVYAMLLSGF